jgi:cytochrome c-type biogenesis protein CcmF
MITIFGDIARFLNIACFLLSVASIFAYIKAMKDDKWIKLARVAFHSMTVGIILMSLSLVILIVNHQYQFAYVFHNSSNDLPLGLLLSTFYAGQEGSFLLWTLILAVIGIFLLKNSEKHNYEPEVMSSFIFVMFFLILLVMFKSPFEKVWEVFPDSIRTGAAPSGMSVIRFNANTWFGVPPDGNGLNPLLQNFWMQIHPPILFVGFALMAVPFAFAIAGLLKKDFQNWIKMSIPWILLGSTILGAGIILGGFWAYETLGWGGYWGWDPVENSSLIPWIVSVALVHTAYTQRKTGGLVKTNLFLAIISFVLVIYSTFLTRSGVLQDSSVHSFTEPGATVYLILLAFLAGFLIFSIALLVSRLKDISRIKIEYNLLTKEVALSLGSLTLAVSAFIILIGTSYPILAKSNVDTSFYDNWNLPLAILIAFLNGYSLLVKWKENDKKDVFKRSIYGLIFSVIATAITIIMGVSDVIILILIWSSFFALYINAERLYGVLRGVPIKMGAFVAHIGISLLLLGIVGSARYSQQKNVQLPMNKTVNVFGYNMTYIGEEAFDSGKKSYFNIKVEKDGLSEILKPVMFVNPMGNGLMKIPDIKVTASKDVYIAPVSLEVPKEGSDVFELDKGKPQNIDDYTLTFMESKMGEHNMEQMKMGGQFSISVKVKVEYPNNTSEVLELTTTYNQTNPQLIPVKTKDKKSEFALIKLYVPPGSGAKAQISYKSLNSIASKLQEEILVAEVSIKPFIILFWGGSIIMTLGFFVSILRRWKELKQGISNDQ